MFEKEYLLFILSIAILFYNYYTLLFYILGFLTNICFNYFLKLIFKQHRPKENKETLLLMENYGKTFDALTYGFPAEEPQIISFSIVFIFLYLKHKLWIIIYLFILINNIIQNFNNNTFLQLISGILIGGIVGFLFYQASIFAIKQLKP